MILHYKDKWNIIRLIKLCLKLNKKYNFLKFYTEVTINLKN